MNRRVQLSGYGGVEVLSVVDTPPSDSSRDIGPDQVLFQVVAAGINPGEIAIREGALAAMFLTDVPFGQGSDFAGRVIATGGDVRGFAVGDEVLGWSDTRSAHADVVHTDIRHLAAKPLAWTGSAPEGCGRSASPPGLRSGPSPQARSRRSWSAAQPAVSATSQRSSRCGPTHA